MTSILDARLLVADDNPDNRDVLIRRLRRLGYTHIESAEDGQKALDMNAADPFDVILLDVMMPRLSGIEVLERLHAEGRLEATPVIMISATTELDTVVRCLTLGAEDYLPKPLNPALLKARLGSVLEKHHLRAELRRHLDRIEGELNEARVQQISMVPAEFPAPSGGSPVEVHAAMRPAREVGGDFYDCFRTAGGALCIAVGDVSGKGVPAALFMARARSLLRAVTLLLDQHLGRTPSPDEVVLVMNQELCKNNPICNFITIFIGLLEPGSNTLHFINAGHVRPYVLPRGGEPFEYVSHPDMALGFMPEATFHAYAMELAQGDALVVVSDGVHDMETAAGVPFGRVAPLICLANAPVRGAEPLVSHLMSAVFGHGEGAEQADDVTILALCMV